MNLPEEPQPLRGDAVRVAQIIVNLLNNAAKYTEEGGRVEVDVGREGRSLTVAVRDNGVGIAAADRRLSGLKLIALTGWGQEEDRLRSRASGFDHHLVKPVDISLLQTLLGAGARAA